MNKNVKEIANKDVDILLEKEKTYGDSWKKRGGIGAFMMLARKWDRIENQCFFNGFDIFKCDPTEKDGLLDDISDLRRYLLLVESEILNFELVKPKVDTFVQKYEYATPNTDDLTGVKKYPDDYQEQLAVKMEKMREDAMFSIPEHLRSEMMRPMFNKSVGDLIIKSSKEIVDHLNDLTPEKEYVSPMLKNFWKGEEPRSQGYVNQDGNDQYLSSNPTKY